MHWQKEQHLVGVGENYTMTTTDSTFKVNPSALPDCPWVFKDQKKGMVGISCNNNIIIDLPVSDGYMIHDYGVTDLDFLSNGGVFTDHRFLYWNFLSHWNAVIQHTIIPHLKNRKRNLHLDSKIQRWSSEAILQFDVLPALSLIKLKLLWKEILNQNIYYIKWLKEEICLEVGSRGAAVRTNKHANHYYWVIFLSTYTVHVAKPVIYDSMHHMIKRFPTCDLGFIDANGWINGISFAVRDGKSFDIYSKKIEISLNSILKHLQPTINFI